MSRIYHLQEVVAPAPLPFEAPNAAQSQGPSSVGPVPSEAEITLDRAIARRLVRRLPDLNPREVESIVNRTRVCNQIKLLTNPSQEFSAYYQQGGTFSKVVYVAEALLNERELREAQTYNGHPGIGINADLVIKRLEQCVDSTYGTFARWLNWFTFYLFCHGSLKKAEEIIKTKRS